MDDLDLTRRAMRAYFLRYGTHADIPSNASGVETTRAGRHYVVLRGGRSASGICAVYHVTKGHKLRHAARFPVELAA